MTDDGVKIAELGHLLIGAAGDGSGFITASPLTAEANADFDFVLDEPRSHGHAVREAIDDLSDRQKARKDRLGY
jgi:hypothetical protein